MNRKIILAIIVNLLLVVSTNCLVLLISRPAVENDATTKLRLTFLVAVHALMFIMMIIIICIEQTYYLIVAIFASLFIISVSLYICEIKVQQIASSPQYQYTHYAYHLEKLELTYLNIYFLIYMYSLIGLIPSGLFLIATEGLMFWQEHVINKYKSRCLKRIPFCEALKDSDCSICLAQFSEQGGEQLMMILCCGHIYHEKCLCEWMRYNTKCPMDRKDIFTFIEEEE